MREARTSHGKSSYWPQSSPSEVSIFSKEAQFCHLLSTAHWAQVQPMLSRGPTVFSKQAFLPTLLSLA